MSDDPTIPPGGEAACAERLALSQKALSVMRHDLRNLLASVTIIAGRMEDCGDERLAKAAPLLVSSMERTVALGVRAGELAGAMPGEPRAVALTRVLGEVEGASGAAVEGAATVRADEAQLGAILTELLANARAAGDAVTVRIGRDGDEVAVRVTDDGPGVPDYAQEHLFTPFKGAKRRDGTGLGLPLAARLAAMNDGALRLEETGPNGSTFLLTLPAG